MSRSQLRSAGPGDYLSVHLAWNHDHATLAIAGELDLTTVHHLYDAVPEIMVRPARAVNLDLSRLTFADAAGVRALDQAARELHQIGRQVSVVGIQPIVRQVAELIGSALTAMSLRSPDGAADQRDGETRP